MSLGCSKAEDVMGALRMLATWCVLGGAVGCCCAGGVGAAGCCAGDAGLCVLVGVGAVKGWMELAWAVGAALGSCPTATLALQGHGNT